MRDTFVRILIKRMRTDTSIFVVTADMGFGVFEELKKEFPDRFLNAGVAEANSVGVSAGLAMSGYTVIFYAQASFATLRCFEQIRLDVASNNLNVKIAGTSSGFTLSQYGTSHYSVEDMGIMRTLPNMTILSPGDLFEAEAATNFMLDNDGPMYLRIGRSNAGPDIKIHRTMPLLRAGRPLMVRRGGSAIIFAAGSMLYNALRAWELLMKSGVKSSLFSSPFLKPIDTAFVKKILKGKNIIFTLEEHSEIGGLGSAIAELVAENNMKI